MSETSTTVPPGPTLTAVSVDDEPLELPKNTPCDSISIPAFSGLLLMSLIFRVAVRPSDVLSTWARPSPPPVPSDAPCSPPPALSLSTASYNSDLCKFAEHRGKIIGTICCRLELMPALQSEGGDPKDGDPAQGEEKDAKRLKVTHDEGDDVGDEQVALPLSRLYIMTLGVLPAYRSRFIGSSLLSSVLTAISSTPASSPAGRVYATIRSVYLHVQTSNVDALSFYEKHGFVVKGEIKGYYKHVQPPDCFLLEKEFVIA